MILFSPLNIPLPVSISTCVSPLPSPLHCCYSYTALNLSLSPYVSILGRVQVAVGDLPSNVLTSLTNYLCLSAFGLVYPQAIAGVWYEVAFHL